MQGHHRLHFDAFHLDLANEQLHHDQQVIRLTRKAFAVLRHLVTRAGELVTKDDLVIQVWQSIAVTDAALTACIRELRRVLGDPARTPRYIETVYGRGYRFIAPVQGEEVATPLARPPQAEAAGHEVMAWLRPVALVGREPEWAQMQQWLTAAQQGVCQLGFLAGEPGIGKTALLETFVSHCLATYHLWVGYGQCLESYGSGEPYLPLLEALGRLCRGPEGDHFRTLLWHHAPSWLAQMPSVLAPEERRALAVTSSGGTQVRMLRELTEAFHALTAERPLILLLEDVHWSDSATVTWLAYMARRRESCRLLVLSAYRPVEVMARAHPLQAVLAELRPQGLCRELQLDTLSAEAVAQYLLQHCGAPQVPSGLVAAIYHRTRGHPFFLRALIDELLQHGVLQEGRRAQLLPGDGTRVTTMVPSSVQALIEQQVERLPAAAQELLETAGVVATTFTVEAVAAGSGQPSDDVARHCERWARQGHFLEAVGTERWPDGTYTGCYRFRHDLYAAVLAARVSAWRRIRLHRAIGLRKEAGYGAQASTIAAELAWHFEQGQEVSRAMTYLRHAATTAAQRSAHDEALAYLYREQTLLAALAPSPMRRRQELTLYVALGTSLFATHGFGAPEVLQTYEHARALCQQQEATPEYALVYHGLCTFYLMRGNFHTAWTFAEDMFQLAQQFHDTDIALEASCMLGSLCFFWGDHARAMPFLTQAQARYDPEQHREHVLVYGLDPGVLACSLASWTLHVQGYLAQAVRCNQQAMGLGQTLLHVHSRAFALAFAGWGALMRRDYESARSLAEAAILLCQDHGFPHLLAEGQFIWGRALLAQGQGEEGVTHMVEALVAYQAVEAQLALPMFFTLLAEGYAALDRIEDGLHAVTEGLTCSERTGERWWDAELHRLRGTFLLAQAASQHHEAAVCFHHALHIAQRQQAHLLELRAAMSLARLWQCQGQYAAAYALLAPIYGWFTEGFETADLREARALLEALAC